jgi:hypothetical protein
VAYVDDVGAMDGVPNDLDQLIDVAGPGAIAQRAIGSRRGTGIGSSWSPM